MNHVHVCWCETGEKCLRRKRQGLHQQQGLASSHSQEFGCFTNMECLWPHRALGHGIKGCAAPGSASSSSSLECLSSRNEVSLSLLHLSLWAELLSRRLSRPILGLPRLGLDTELSKGRQPFRGGGWGQLGRGGFVPAEGDQWGSAAGGCAQQNLHLPWCSKMSPDISNTAMSLLDMGCDPSFHRGLKATVLGHIPEVRRPSCAVPLTGQKGDGGSCGHRAYFEDLMCPWRELRDRQTDPEAGWRSLLCVAALPPAPRDVLLQTLSPTALRPLWPNPPCKQLQ